jgi:hypothetical protein
MKNRKIAIVTGWGGQLGTGHVQRMAALMVHLNNERGADASIVADAVPDFIHGDMKSRFTREIHDKPDLIIRDMRDSPVYEMESLKKIGKVLTIDDLGEGRALADFAVDILPNHKFTGNVENLSLRGDVFIYGYNFISSIRKLAGENISKTIDASLYPGYGADNAYIEFLTSLVPEGSNYAVLSGNNSYVMMSGAKFPLEKSYAETILSSKIVMAHFGITLYEGHIAGCVPVAVNPSDYHSKLADIAARESGFVNLGVYGKIEKRTAKNIIKSAVEKNTCPSVKADEILEKIRDNLDHFASIVESLII